MSVGPGRLLSTRRAADRRIPIGLEVLTEDDVIGQGHPIEARTWRLIAEGPPITHWR